MTETTNPQPDRFRAVFTVTVETKPGGDYYFDHSDFARHVGPWIEGALEDRDDIRDVTVVEAEGAAPAAVPSAPADQTALDRVRALHQPFNRAGLVWCAHCSHWDGRRARGVLTDYPCDTLHALDEKPDDGPRCMADEAQQPETQAAELALMFEGFGNLLATSSRDWGQYAPDAWLYAVILGWDCEEDEHDETCTHGAMEEMQERHGWDDDAVAKARRYRAMVRTITEPAAVSQPGKEA